ncbi:ABC transporter substrate-binding protein [Undibacterium sp.]|jgi:peptide/nickel transport system substrate-binding protein|uniref:ABC transporter substrate-binding protein n=1 Tax=Undibacterium sp. TaxID=1914977 RepID=UPI002B9D14C9|nr:ABC transporter substrate-binding protein [Undibacterium sp.]HTD05209.1 ABC transporter substrate-binding protein [Undibacterium sp.]
MQLRKIMTYLGAFLISHIGAGTSNAAPLPEIRFADAIETPTSIPGHRSRNTATDGVMLHVVESLVALRDDLSVAPMLADSWQISPDGKTYKFKLRKGVTFHNGAPLTAADVQWSLKWLMDPKSESYCRNQYDGTRGAKVIGVEAPSPDTVIIRLEKPYGLFLMQTANIQCPLAVLHPSSVDAHGNWIKPVATGPYVFSEWKKGQYILLTPYAGYKPRSEPSSGLAGAKLAQADVRFVLIPDASAQKAALMSGQVDAIIADSENPPPKDPRWTVAVEQDIDTNALLMQTRDPLLSNLKLRRAIATILDLPALARALTGGAAPYNPSLVPVVSRYYSAVHKVGFTKNIDAAKKLLAEAGYRGETLKIQTNKRYPDVYRMALLTQMMLSKAGIKTELEVLEWATQVTNFREGKFQLMAFTYSARIDPAIMYADILGDKTKAPMLQWTNPDASKILADIDAVGFDSPSSAGSAIRKAAFESLHKLMIDDVPMIMLYNTPVLVAFNNNLSGFKPWPLRRPRFFNVSKK